jgi:alanine-synthesizing transaminase
MVECPKASMYIWARIPRGVPQAGFAGVLASAAGKGQVCVSPGIGFGDHGDEHVRFALIENEPRIRQAVRGIKAMFKADGLMPPVA